MTTDQLYEDLTQFINSRAAQSDAMVTASLKDLEERIDKKIDKKLGTLKQELKQDITSLEKKVDDGFAGIATSIEDSVNSRIDDLEERMDTAEVQLKRLRHLAA